MRERRRLGGRGGGEWEEWSPDLRRGTLELQQHHGTGTLHYVEVEQQRLLPVEGETRQGSISMTTRGMPHVKSSSP